MCPYSSVVASLREYLTKNSLKISLAESCTGGLITSMLTDIEGASDFLEQACVAYCEAAKTELLGVNPKTISQNGVVSAQVAAEMADGLIKRYGGVALATTGLLGPKGDGKNPIGTVFIAIATQELHAVKKYHSKKHTRTGIKQDIALKTLEYLHSVLCGEK